MGMAEGVSEVMLVRAVEGGAAMVGGEEWVKSGWRVGEFGMAVRVLDATWYFWAIDFEILLVV